MPIEIVLDARRRTSLARVGNKAHTRYLAATYDDGTIVLTPAVAVPLAEWEASLRIGMAQASAGQLVSLGSFAQYLDEDDPDATPVDT